MEVSLFILFYVDDKTKHMNINVIENEKELSPNGSHRVGCMKLFDFLMLQQ